MRRSSEAGSQVQVDVNDGRELFRGGIGHDLENPPVDEGAEREKILPQFLGKRVVFLGQFNLKNTPNQLIELQGLVQALASIRCFPVCLAFFQRSGCLG